MRRIALLANTDWYLYNFRLALAVALRNHGHDVVMISPPGPYVPKFEAAGLRYIPFPFDRLSLNPVAQLSAVLRLAKIYRRERLDLAHHFTIKCAVYGSMAARLAGPRAVVNAFTGFGSAFASPDKHRLTRRIVLNTLKLTLARTHVIVQNPEDRDLLLNQRLATPDRMWLIRGSGVNLDRFSPALSPASQPLRVLLATRLIRAKGIEAFEAVAARLKERHHAEFVIAGAADQGNPDTLSREEQAALTARGHVRLLGHVDDMPALLSSVALVVLPTRYAEGVPRSLIEAAAAGKPLVAFDVAGCREIVHTDDNGVLTKPGDIDALTTAVDRLLSDAALRARMGESSRRIAAEFSEDVVIANTLQVYAHALGVSDAG